MNKYVVIGVVVIGIVVGGVAIWYAGSNSKPQETNTKTEEVVTIEPTQPPVDETTTGEVKEITVEGSSFKFEPAVIRVKKGDTVNLTFKSVGTIHDFVIDELGVKTNQIGDEEEETVEFVANKAGTYEYYCSVGKHRQMGMVGKLIVE